MAQLYKKKPVIVEVLQWDGDNLIDIFKFIGKTANYGDNSGLTIYTLEGEMNAAIGDYIIKGVNGEFYPCKPDIFHKTYEVYE